MLMFLAGQVFATVVFVLSGLLGWWLAHRPRRAPVERLDPTVEGGAVARAYLRPDVNPSPLAGR